eukprot:6179001-Pleurochrysis_carterae.AAC.5
MVNRGVHCKAALECSDESISPVNSGCIGVPLQAGDAHNIRIREHLDSLAGRAQQPARHDARHRGRPAARLIHYPVGVMFCRPARTAPMNAATLRHQGSYKCH